MTVPSPADPSPSRPAGRPRLICLTGGRAAGRETVPRGEIAAALRNLGVPGPSDPLLDLACEAERRVRRRVAAGETRAGAEAVVVCELVDCADVRAWGPVVATTRGLDGDRRRIVRVLRRWLRDTLHMIAP